ncbi:S9 family peptidase [Robertkochia aurantiaca]|uniref:S9 family peptidase n=1 Tax=Robertkochia aurantiaca TaxID=2873700 RepID=UPI001CC8FF8E|nr:S9 family peptidase [Robertkochia sp. 3YJGBD-33]
MRLLLFLAVASVSLMIRAQEKQTLTPEDISNLRSVTNAMLSEDGEHILYTITVPADPKESNELPETHLFKHSIASGQQVTLVNNLSVSQVQFRPGSQTVSFIAKPEGQETSAIYEIALSGGDPEKVFEFTTDIKDYYWHPNGSVLAFTANPPEENEEGSELPYQPEIYEEEQINTAAYIVSLEEAVSRKVNMDYHVSQVKWSPEGSHLAVKAAPSPLVDDFYTSSKIFIVNPSSYQVSRRIDHTAKLGDFEWSPDGKHIAMIAGADKNDPIDGRLLITALSDGEPRIIKKDYPGAFEQVAWLDNQHLMTISSEGVYSKLQKFDIGNDFETVFHQKDIDLSHFSVNKGGIIALIANTPQHPDELYLKSGDSNVKRLTDLNPWLKEKAMGKQEVISYAADDGTRVEGILIHPVSQLDNAPLITVVHGGPEAHYDNGWLTAYSVPGQMAAGKGYAVFYPNYRGSTGRGLTYAMSSQGDPAGKEFDDIIDGIDHLIENYGIDGSRVGVTGGSYGGYATAWMATRHTERFAAGVMFVGISNNLSKWGTSDIPEEMFLVHSRKRIWDDYQFFLERSPIYYADQSKTPLLIMAGKDDTRVDPGQSYELYRHIKTRTDTPVRLVLYPGEGHGNRKSTARYDYSLRMLRWFDTYLKKEGDAIPEKPTLKD